MRRAILFATASLLFSGGVFAATVAPPANEIEAEAMFDTGIHADELRGWMKTMAAEPNHVGSPHDKANAEYVLKQFKDWGWDAHIEEFQVLYPTPITASLELTGKTPFKATLQEKPIPGDSSATARQYALPAYVAYQGDGDVTAPLVYVNYGMQDDYKALERMGVSVKGKIVVTRYGGGWRGLKPKLAQDHGAVGCIIYSDPADDGYGQDSVYPNGPQRPPQGIQRGSVADMPIYPGDPLTPGVGATKDAKRLTRETAATILKIPTLPISYADAKVMLASMDGNVVPDNWKGTLPITYRVGGSSTATAHMVVKSDWSLKTIYDVIATMKGSTYPDQWVMRGNHHDGWVFGASDPLSGHVAMMAEAKSIGELAKTGWRPKRTLVYASWDAEEPMLLGSTEWVETHADELQKKLVVYINSDGNGRGFLNAGGNHDFQFIVNQVAMAVTDPETKVDVRERLKAGIRVAALGPDANPGIAAKAKVVADPMKDVPIDALGSGSDYSAFIEHLGVPALNIGFGGEGDAGGVYHSRYDTFEHHSRFVDPGFVYDALLAKMAGRLVLRIAEADLPVQHAGDFADTIAFYLKDVEKLADTRREAAETQADLLRTNAFALADDPTHTHAAPTALLAVPKFDFKAMDDAAAALKKSADAYDAALAKNGAHLADDKVAKLQALMLTLSQTLTSPTGLPGRPWYRNLIYAPGRYTGYGAKTLPGIREAIEDQRFDDVPTYVKLTADVLNAYSARLDQATAVLNGG
ncbi:MAG TPA: transferrin receptor-like dimerization domain-containing protein [Rhizomicrobium sp.]|nr:transferrin receptor-like dimerization domain-containing protein [Rhizomicrobium sp.]